MVYGKYNIPPTTHYTDAIRSSMAYQINSLTVVYSTSYSGGDKKKNIKFTGDRWIPRTKGQ